MCVYGNRNGNGQVLVCDSAISQPLCPSTIITCICTVNGTFSSTRWNFSTLHQCPRLYNAITLPQPYPCAPPFSISSGQCGPYLTASNNSPNKTGNVPCQTSTLTITTNPVLNGLVFECQDYTSSAQGTSSGTKEINIIGLPSSPSITSLTYLPDQLIVGWSFVPIATNYNVSINDSIGNTFFLPATVNSIALTGLAMNTVYTISVAAINCAGASNAVYINAEMFYFPSSPVVILSPSTTVAKSSDLHDSLVASAVGISVSITCLICFLTGVFVAIIIYCATRMRKRPTLHGITVYDEVGKNKFVKPITIEMDKNSAYGLH